MTSAKDEMTMLFLVCLGVFMTGAYVLASVRLGPKRALEWMIRRWYYWLFLLILVVVLGPVNAGAMPGPWKPFWRSALPVNYGLYGGSLRTAVV